MMADPIVMDIYLNGDVPIVGDVSIQNHVAVSPPVTKFGATIDSIIGNVDENGALGNPAEQTSIVFDGVKEIGYGVCQYMFYFKNNITGVAFPELTTIDGIMACSHMCGSCFNLNSVSFPVLETIFGYLACPSMFFNCSNLTSLSFPALTTIRGDYACQQMLKFCGKMVSVSFPVLTTIDGKYVCEDMFYGCGITSISFPALAEILPNDITNQFTGMFTYCYELTEIHFPATMKARIEQLDGYVDKWGAEYATIYFDL